MGFWRSAHQITSRVKDEAQNSLFSLLSLSEDIFLGSSPCDQTFFIAKRRQHNFASTLKRTRFSQQRYQPYSSFETNVERSKSIKLVLYRRCALVLVKTLLAWRSCGFERRPHRQIIHRYRYHEQTQKYFAYLWRINIYWMVDALGVKNERTRGRTVYLTF